MSVPVSVLDKEASANKADSTENLMASVTERMKAISRRQKWQDGIFHGVTFLFALFVLMVLAGILVSLIHSSIPAFKEFGFAFITTVEWDPVNDVYGAAIAIFGTLVTSFIALADRCTGQFRYCPVFNGTLSRLAAPFDGHGD